MRLAAAEARAPVADARVVAVRQAGDEVVDAGGVGGGADVGGGGQWGRLGEAVGDVCGDGGGEEGGVLGDDGDEVAEGGHVEAADVAAVDGEGWGGEIRVGEWGGRIEA